MADQNIMGDMGSDPYQADLNPDLLAGQNYGLEGPHPEKADDIRTAYDIKNLHNRLSEFEDDDLKGIPVLPPGTRLEQRAVYIDLRESEPKEIKGRAGQTAGQKNWYVPKSEVDYVVWNRLIGVTNPERLDQADEGATDQASQAGARGRGGRKTAAASTVNAGEETPPRTRRRASTSSASANASGPAADMNAAAENASSPEQAAQYIGISGGVPEADSGQMPRIESYGNELH
jgi:hypothetical protein